MPRHILYDQWVIDHKCVTCGVYNTHYHECPDCIKLRSREQVQRWTQNNPGGIKVHAHASRARKLGLTEHFSVEEWQELCKKYNNICPCCQKKKPLTPDHIVALTKGGTNTIDNIQPLCRPCNARKGTQYIDYRA